MKRDAFISSCGLFRYWLWREWNAALPRLVWVMLNPSIADGLIDDQTVRKCIGFAMRAGYGSIVVVNLFAFRATKPADLKAAGWQVGPTNDHVIRQNCQRGAPVVCAWGAHTRGQAAARAHDVVRTLRASGCYLFMIGQTADGIPWHPLTFAYAHGINPLPSTLYAS